MIKIKPLNPSNVYISGISDNVKAKTKKEFKNKTPKVGQVMDLSQFQTSTQTRKKQETSKSQNLRVENNTTYATVCDFQKKLKARHLNTNSIHDLKLLLDSLNSQYPSSSIIQHSYAQFYLEQNNYGEALNYANESINLQSSDSKFYTTRAIIYEKLNDTANAIKDLEKALVINTDFFSLYRLAKIYFDLENYVKAIKYSSRSIAYKKRFTYSNQILIESYINTNQYKLANDKINEVISYFNKEPIFYYLKAIVQEKQSIDNSTSLQAALTRSKNYLSYVSKNPYVHLNHAKILFKLNKTDESLKSINIALKLNPSLSLAYKQLTECYNKLGDTKNQVKTHEKLVSLKPNEESYKYLLKHYKKNQDTSDMLICTINLSLMQLSKLNANPDKEKLKQMRKLMDQSDNILRKQLNPDKEEISKLNNNLNSVTKKYLSQIELISELAKKSEKFALSTQYQLQFDKSFSDLEWLDNNIAKQPHMPSFENIKKNKLATFTFNVPKYVFIDDYLDNFYAKLSTNEKLKEQKLKMPETPDKQFELLSKLDSQHIFPDEVNTYKKAKAIEKKLNEPAMEIFEDGDYQKFYDAYAKRFKLLEDGFTSYAQNIDSYLIPQIEYNVFLESETDAKKYKQWVKIGDLVKSKEFREKHDLNTDMLTTSEYVHTITEFLKEDNIEYALKTSMDLYSRISSINDGFEKIDSEIYNYARLIKNQKMFIGRWKKVIDDAKSKTLAITRNTAKSTKTKALVPLLKSAIRELSAMSAPHKKRSLIQEEIFMRMNKIQEFNKEYIKSLHPVQNMIDDVIDTREQIANINQKLETLQSANKADDEKTIMDALNTIKTARTTIKRTLSQLNN